MKGPLIGAWEHVTSPFLNAPYRFNEQSAEGEKKETSNVKLHFCSYFGIKQCVHAGPHGMCESPLRHNDINLIQEAFLYLTYKT